jgi:hypothetical protein
MPKRRIFQYAEQNLATANLVIDPRALRGYRLLELGVAGAGAGQGLIVTVNDERHSFIPGVSGLSDVAFPKFISDQTAGYYEQLRRQFPQVPLIHAGEDEGITIERANAAGAGTAYAWWEELEGEDIPNPLDPGGSRNDNRVECQVGQQTWPIAAGATEIEDMTTTVMPTGFRTYPFAETIPTDRVIDWLGMVIGYDATGSPNTTCDGIRVFVREQSILANEEDFCPITVFPPTNTAQDQRLGLFQEPVRLQPGDQVRVQFQFTNGGGAAENPLIHCVFICHRMPLS